MPTPKLQTTEADLREQIRDLAQLYGWEMHFAWLSWRSPKGYPDVFLAHPVQKRVIWAELKGKNGKLTPEQVRWLQVLRDCGQEAYTWWPDDIPEIARLLQPRDSKQNDRR